LNPQTLVVNPKIKILHRKGVLFAGQLSGLAQPVQLLEFDIALLHVFLQPEAPQNAINEILGGATGQLLPAVPAVETLKARIEQLYQSQVLISGDAGPQMSNATDGPTDLNACSESKIPDDKIRLRLGSNIAIIPKGNYFRVWSPARRKYFYPGIELLLLLVSFLTDTVTGEVIATKSQIADSDSRRKGIGWLLEAGLLIRSDDKPVIPRRTDTQASVSRPAVSGPRWQDIQPDDRIPIYFTPHMENHYPLALGMISAAISAYNDGELLKTFQLLPISYMSPQQLMTGPLQRFGTGVWLFSNYMWSLDVNLQISKMIKSRDPGSLTIHGGPSTPGYPAACAKFMNRNRSVDIAVHGEGEVAAVEVLRQVFRSEEGKITYSPKTLEGVEGLTIRPDNAAEGLITTKPRTRLREPDSIPSPYLTGVFDSYEGNVEAAIIESNRGCPFGCTFCDWGSATNQKVRKFDLERVQQEIEWIGRNKVRVLWIADANFGMYDRDIELSEHIVATRKKHGFPQEVVVNYTKNTTRRLVDIVRTFSTGGIISQGIISIQTTDETTLEVINRKNIKTEKYDELTAVFAAANLPLSTDLMIGLPGITPAAFDRDLQRYFDIDVSTKAYPTQLLPNSPMADPEYMEKYQIRVDEDDFIISCHSFNETELAAMKSIFNVFTVADGYATLRYILRFLQWEHGIPAMSLLHCLQEAVTDSPGDYPAISWAIKFFTTDKFMPGGWKVFYDEIAAFTDSNYGISRDGAFDTVLLVNELAMPDDTIDYPLEVSLNHDVAAWFRDHNGKPVHQVKPLASYPPGKFRVDDPDSMASIDMDYIQYDSHQYFWELRSPTARAKSVSDATTTSIAR